MKVTLKENSPEYADAGDKPKASVRRCDTQGCQGAGEFKAPKNNQLNEHHWFCETHIKEYNAAWDFFAGLSAEETERIYRDTIYGERPTRKMQADADFLSRLRSKVFEFSDFAAFTDRMAKKNPNPHKKPVFELPHNHPVAGALRLFELPLTATEADIKTRYRDLVKNWHPDRHNGSVEAEEKLKQINMAYTLLKARFDVTAF